MRRHLSRVETTDAGSTYAINGTVTNIAWTALNPFHIASLPLGSPDALLMIEFYGTVENASATDFAEVRLQVTEPGPTVYAGVQHYLAPNERRTVHCVLVAPDPTAGTDFTGTMTNAGLYARSQDVGPGSIYARGSGILDIWKLTKVEVP
jgi:hypothetical protein